MKRRAKQLQTLMSQLSAEQQQSVTDFAEFLVQRKNLTGADSALLTPENIQRPAEESVVEAIKRLKQTYHMLDTSALLNQTSALMGQHILQGRDAASVIDDLQALFQANYEAYRQQC
ncbi:MAG: Crp/Fnr family transcriptional regulator [Gammaproteobacteria bacterium]|nr:Crp/Fnr family transcriptional regulator [Gammaproteobacteria bacterium]